MKKTTLICIVFLFMSPLSLVKVESSILMPAQQLTLARLGQPLEPLVYPKSWGLQGIFSLKEQANSIALGVSADLALPQSGSSSYSIAKKKTKTKKKMRRKKRRRRLKKSYRSLAEALRLSRQGKYEEASMRLFQLSHSPRYIDKRTQIKYVLGLILYQMNLNQLSAFQFIGVTKKGNSRYLQQSLEKLSLAADTLGDDSLLNYAISKVRVKDFPKVHRDMLYYRIGEFQMRNGQMKEAAHSFSLVNSSSHFYNKAKYLQALAYSEKDQIKEAVNAFDELIDHQLLDNPTNINRVVGIMGKARAFYQGKKWDQAIEYYREIPRDTAFWHDTLFESSWAMLRSGRFRSALSNLQSLHTPYYEDFYLPESLLLRAIVYLYICKYHEMEKVLNLFNKIYKPVYLGLNNYLKTKNSARYFKNVAEVLRDYNKLGEKIERDKYVLPFQITRRILKEADFRRSYGYIKKLVAERKRHEAMSDKWKRSALGRYSKKVLETRILKARKKSGQQIRAHMIAMKKDLRDLFEQEGFIRFEMGNSARENLKQRVAGTELPRKHIDEDRTRDFYIQDGFEYWPFRGEYWLDEIGNYHYVGTHSCGS